VAALDHDLAAKEKLIPVGILEVESGQLDLTFGSSHKTSDLLADCLEGWWGRRGKDLAYIEELVLHADNGPESSGRRTQLLARLADFADASGLRIRLVYYPPYHSKYNPIERCKGCAGKTLEWGVAQGRANRAGLGENDDLERTGSGGPLHSQALQKGRAGHRSGQAGAGGALAAFTRLALVGHPHPTKEGITFFAVSLSSLANSAGSAPGKALSKNFAVTSHALALDRSYAP
jgi:hypothetical protein